MNSYLTGAIVAVALISGTVNAAPINIVATPQETNPPILHNVFHYASGIGGTTGTIRAYFDMNSGGGSWDPVTGAFSLNIDLNQTEDLTGLDFGTATGTGTLAAGAFNGFDGGLIGTILWDFDATAEALGLLDTTMYFYDISYITSASGYQFNSTVGSYDSMSLWGANGTADPLTGMFDTNTTSLGVDLVVTFAAVPVPPAVWLFGSGLLGLVGVARRRKQQS
jgi:hypothetical protein